MSTEHYLFDLPPVCDPTPNVCHVTFNESEFLDVPLKHHVVSVSPSRRVLVLRKSRPFSPACQSCSGECPLVKGVSIACGPLLQWDGKCLEQRDETRGYMKWPSHKTFSKNHGTKRFWHDTRPDARHCRACGDDTHEVCLATLPGIYGRFHTGCVIDLLMRNEPDDDLGRTTLLVTKRWDYALISDPSTVGPCCECNGQKMAKRIIYTNCYGRLQDKIAHEKCIWKSQSFIFLHKFSVIDNFSVEKRGEFTLISTTRAPECKCVKCSHLTGEYHIVFWGKPAFARRQYAHRKCFMEYFRMVNDGKPLPP